MSFPSFDVAIETSLKKSVYSAIVQSHLQYAINICGEKNNLMDNKNYKILLLPNLTY